MTCPELFQDIPAFIAEILARRGVASTQELELKLKHLLAPSLKGFNDFGFARNGGAGRVSGSRSL